MNLWHLFSTDESYKLDTFLAGGLWCSELGSIVGFGDDIEGRGREGIFVSCWHASEGDPTHNSWKIFGGNGDGFAIRTATEELTRYAARFTNPILAAQFGRVQYVPDKTLISDPAFQVMSHHENEEEMRLALRLKEQVGDEYAMKNAIRAAVESECSGRDFGGKVSQLTFSARDDSDFAIILPIDKTTLFKEFVIGPGVSPVARTQAIENLTRGEIHCPVRVAPRY